MKAAPYRVSSRGKARFRISVANMGTSDARLNLGATDLEEGLNFKFNPGTTVVVPAWKSIEIPVIVKPKKGRRVGPRRRFDITFTTSTEDGNTQTANGELDFRPVISSWGTIFRTVRILIFVGIIAGLIGFLIHWGGGFTLLRTSPQTWWNQLADQFVNTFGGWFSAN